MVDSRATLPWRGVQPFVTLEWTTHVIADDAMMADSMFAIDVDGDGDIDVLSASDWDNRVAWYENMAGDGRNFTTHTITTEAEYAYGHGHGEIGRCGVRRVVFAIDVDADGDADVLSASVDDDTIAWYENMDGSGRNWTNHTITDSADGACSLHAIDVDGDGDVDVFSTSEKHNAVAWHENMYVKTRDSGIPILSR